VIIKYSVDDLASLNFRYMIQVSNHETAECVFHCDNPGFWLEKRLRFVVRNDDETCFLHGYYYGQKSPMTAEDLVALLNKGDKRYYRLLNNKELRWLNNWLQGQ
jgi:hypothetical protein